MDHDALIRQAAQFGVSLNGVQLAAFDLYEKELLVWNERVNLTAVVEPEQIVTRHFVDSLSALLALEQARSDQDPVKMIDVGSGAGFPGLPIKLVWSETELTLVESTGKKMAFLRHLVDELGLVGVSVLNSRAEDLAR